MAGAAGEDGVVADDDLPGGRAEGQVRLQFLQLRLPRLLVDATYGVLRVCVRVKIKAGFKVRIGFRLGCGQD